MKKIITIILAAILLGISAAGMTGCAYDIEKYFISDGDFVYFYMENMPEYSDMNYNRKCYAIAGTNFDEPKTEIYVPAYYKGKEVCYTWFVDTSLAQNEYGIDATGAEKVYFPFCHCAMPNTTGTVYDYDGKENEPSYNFFASTSAVTSNILEVPFWSSGKKGTYITSIMYNERKESYANEYEIREINGYKFYVGEYEQFFQIANTSYMFNYEGEPNEGYFFINEFERGGLIEDTPYEPQRAGYKFAGWYKEAACINAWDFERDRLPQAEYDADGNLKFIETKLYAKWVKN